MYGTVLTLIVITSISMQAVQFWAISAGKLRLAYWLMVASGILHTGLATMVGMHDPSQRSMLAFIGLHLWTLAMGVKGLLRLKAVS